MGTDSIQENLNRPYPLTREAIDFYRENGYVKLKSVFDPELLAYYREEITRKVAELNTQHLPIEKRSTYDKAFLQVMNLWTRSDVVREFAFGRRLGRIAAELMACSGVRMYHDQALYKEAGGGITPWHADQYYWPVSNENMVTAWIPLQSVPLEMGPLAFCEKSHRLQVGRDLEIGDESELTLKQTLEKFKVEESSFELGEVSFHSGWTFHRAGPNTTDRSREVMTVIYMDEKMKLSQPKNKNQVADIERWCPGIEPGEVVASPLNPVIYTSGKY